MKTNKISSFCRVLLKIAYYVGFRNRYRGTDNFRGLSIAQGTKARIRLVHVSSNDFSFKDWVNCVGTL